ncbi:hypothetical protein D3C78_565150 [compost metagenome]
MKYTSFALCLLTLAGCTNQETRQMPVQIMTAPPGTAQSAELPRSEQVLRPQDVLDVIFHVSTSGSDTYRN